MIRFIIRRFLWTLLVMFAVSLITFMLMNAIPGGPFDSVGERPLDPNIVKNIEAKYGLDDPLWFRYINYVGGVAIPNLTYGEFSYGLTLDREDAGLERIEDENGDAVKLAFPRRVMMPYQETSVIEDYLINIPLPFLRGNVPANLRDKGSNGGEVIQEVAPATKVTALKLNNNQDYVQVETADGVQGWVSVDRVKLASATFDEANPTAATIIGAPATFRWMNFGPSYESRSQSVNDYFRDQLPVSAQLGLASILVAVTIGVPLGILAGINRNTNVDYMAMSVAILGVSVPVIILGPVLQVVAISVPWLPITGWGEFKHFILPAFALGFAESALIARLTRASLLQVLNEDYIRTARAKGLAERVVILVHAMRNALIPVITVLGPLLAALVTGSFVTERIFQIPGLGDNFITSVTNRDYPMIMGTILLYAFFLVLANMFVDIVYALLDPRIRYD
ncbi:MAG: ABC transporter permease subunit [Phototrophicaceae bacterium]